MEGLNGAELSVQARPTPPEEVRTRKVSPLQRRTSALITMPPTRNATKDVTGPAFPPRSPRSIPHLTDVKEWAAEDRKAQQENKWAPEILGFQSPRAQAGTTASKDSPGRRNQVSSEQQPVKGGAVIGSPRAEQVHFLQNQWQDISLVKEVVPPSSKAERMMEANPKFFPGRRHPPSLEYVDHPRYPTRTSLLEARRRRLRPDVSFDVDGDGSVGVEDYVLASFMDDDKNGFLTEDEKLQAARVKDYFDKEGINVSAAGIKSNRDKLNRELIFILASLQVLNTNPAAPEEFRTIQVDGGQMATHD